MLFKSKYSNTSLEDTRCSDGGGDGVGAGGDVVLEGEGVGTKLPKNCKTNELSEKKNQKRLAAKLNQVQTIISHITSLISRLKKRVTISLSLTRVS